MHSYEQAWAWVTALAGDPNTAVMDWRALHDRDKGQPGHARRGTLPQWWQWLSEMNAQGFGIFATIAMMDGAGRELHNVQYIRAHYVDLDGMDAEQQVQRSANWMAFPPSFGVNSSPGKHHVYWPAVPFAGNDFFTLHQRKLRQLFNGDKAVIDAARVLRVPGTINWKYDQPHSVTVYALPGNGRVYTAEEFQAALASVNVIDGGGGQRRPLGDPELAAPDMISVRRAFELHDPNSLDRAEWISFTAAIKQSMSTLVSADEAFALWSAWCSRYDDNDPAENAKQWASIRDSTVGWGYVRDKVPSLKPSLMFGDPATRPGGQGAPPVAGIPSMPDTSGTGALDCSSEMLTHLEQQTWFNGSIYVVNLGEMLTSDGRFLNASQFNAAFGGKKFIIDGLGKTSNEPWTAATRSTLWTVPKVDQIRFLPNEPYRAVVMDDLGRSGVNVYKPIPISRIQGDVSPWLNHMRALVGSDDDLTTIIRYLAHNAQYPGFKIPWAPVIQSTEGAGKGVMKLTVMHAMGRPYVYFPNAKELTNSGSQFNAWMRNKLFILADEIKVDDRRDLIEVLKPMISEEIIEVQGKGQDQGLEDNFSNWMFFTNWKDAIPVSKNARRFSIIYSPLQTADDLLARNMDEWYFKCLYGWLKGEGNQPNGAAIVADYLLSYPIERGAIPMRAPDTASTMEAVLASRGPIERVIAEAVEDGLPGFRGGWISATAVMNRIKATGAVRGGVSAQTVATVIEAMGYVSCGRATRCYFSEDRESRPYLFHWARKADMDAYGPLQGYSGD